jgi:uncharacterized protein YqcC (DUF446 family)
VTGTNGRAASVDQTPLVDQLNSIEKEMKRIGYWSNHRPSLGARIKAWLLRKPLEVATFELWLQWIFLPGARAAVRTNKMPPVSQVGVMAMRRYDHMACVPEAHRLLELLGEFDELVETKARANKSLERTRGR